MDIDGTDGRRWRVRRAWLPWQPIVHPLRLGFGRYTLLGHRPARGTAQPAGEQAAQQDGEQQAASNTRWWQWLYRVPGVLLLLGALLLLQRLYEIFCVLVFAVLLPLWVFELMWLAVVAPVVALLRATSLVRSRVNVSVLSAGGAEVLSTQGFLVRGLFRAGGFATAIAEQLGGRGAYYVFDSVVDAYGAVRLSTVDSPAGAVQAARPA